MAQKTTPRGDAAEILSKFDPTQQSFLSAEKRLGSLQSPAVKDYVLGVLKNITIIDDVLEIISKVKSERVEPKLLNTLRIAVYELVYSPATPEYAIINEAVSQYKSKSKRGFANAVLRNIQRNIVCRDDEFCESEFVIPTFKGKGCKFKVAIAPAPLADYCRYASRIYSLPHWLLQRWEQDYGKDKLADICAGSNRIPKIYLRPNTTLTTADKLLELLTSGGNDCRLLSDKYIVIENLSVSGGISQLAGYDDGLFCVQDITATAAGEFVSPEKGDVIVDLCAAPGTKTTHLAAMLEGTGRVIATDINAERLELVRENARRMRLENIEVVAYEDIFKYAAGLPKIDKLLIDAPCSNSGVLAKRIEARFRITPDSIDALANQGYELLHRSILDLKPCKQLFYSTCSIENKENTQVLHKLLAHLPKVKLTKELTTLPSGVSYGCDGGYVAKLVL